MRDIFVKSGLAIAGVALVMAPGAALASHGKVGQWETSVTMDMGNAAPAMPDLSKLPPSQRAQVEAMMKARGVNMHGNKVTSQICMTAAEVASDKPPPMRDKSCTMSNVKAKAGSYSADMTCTGQFNGTGHMQVSYDSPEHYKGEMTMKGTADGHPMNMHNSFEGRWVSATCTAPR